ncbi:MAG: hypothetical protein ACKOA8_06775, partial [Deltaproteobacteria bacterium]
MVRRFFLELKDKPFLQGIPYWTGAAFVGTVAVVYSGLFSLAIAATKEFFRNYPYWMFLTSPICFFLATWVVEKYAPAAGGTGVPQVIKALK